MKNTALILAVAYFCLGVYLFGIVETLLIWLALAAMYCVTYKLMRWS